MTTSPALLDRIVAELRRTPGAPRSAGDLARTFLGLGIVDEATAERLLAPALDADARLSRMGQGWVASAGTNPPRRLDEAALALFAPFGAPIAAAAPAGATAGEPSFVVAAGGDAERARAAERLGRALPGPCVDLVRALRRLRGYRGAGDPFRLAEALGAAHVESDEPGAYAAAAAAAWERLVADLALEGVETFDGFEALLEERLARADFGAAEFGPEDLAALPFRPGVYLFRDGANRALYVGQSRSLAARVGSYFAGPPRDEKDRVLRREARRLATRTVDTAPDALMLEARWIRRYRPSLNTRRAVHGGPCDEGILALPAVREPDARGRTDGPLVLFVLRREGLACRVAAARGPARRAAAVRSAVDTLFDPAPGALEREAGALITTWLRIHPEALFLRPAIDGGPAQIAARLLS